MPRMHARTWIVTDFFHRFAHRVAEWVGSPWCFLAALTTAAVEQPVDEVLERVTAKLGGQTIRGPILTESAARLERAEMASAV